MLKEYRNQLKELPMAKTGKILSKKLGKVLLDYYSKQKVNTHKSLLI